MQSDTPIATKRYRGLCRRIFTSVLALRVEEKIHAKVIVAGRSLILQPRCNTALSALELAVLGPVCLESIPKCPTTRVGYKTSFAKTLLRNPIAATR